jgi:hypothetical protein
MSSEILITETCLNKNTIGVIIGYLTDPPVLPYLKELIDKTRDIYKDFEVCVYYSDYYLAHGQKSTQGGKVWIYKPSKRWSVVWAR